MAQVRTDQEMFPLVESWLESGLTQKQFSQQHGVSEHVFCYWVSRYRKGHPADKTKQQSAPQKENPAFIRLSPPAAVVAPPAAVVAAWGVTGGTGPESANPDTAVELPSGVVLRFRGLVPVAYLKELVGLSSPVCSCSA